MNFGYYQDIKIPTKAPVAIPIVAPFNPYSKFFILVLHFPVFVLTHQVFATDCLEVLLYPLPDF